MSGSSKKKLRKESNAAALTEKQQQQAKEAKKLKAYTRSFIVVMVVIVALLVGIVVKQPITDAIYQNVHAITVGDHEISAIELNYFYTDAIFKHYNQYSEKYESYAATYALLIEGIDFTKPMNEQIRDAETKQTWAEAYLDSAILSAKQTYALYDLAMADEEFEYSVEDSSYLSNFEEYLDLYAYYNGFNSVDSYLRGSYGDGASIETYKQYCTVTEIATRYKTQMRDQLEYVEEQYRNHEKDKETNYSRFSYATFVIQVSNYLGEGTTTTDENGKTTTTYTAEEKQAAIDAALADIAILESNEILNGAESLNLALGRLEKYKDKSSAKFTEKTKVFGSTINDSEIMKWLCEEGREVNDVGHIEISTTSKDEDGNEVKEITGYTVVLFLFRDDGMQKLQNVSHILLKIDGMEDYETGEIISDEEDRQVAKNAAEEVLRLWNEKEEKTFEAFCELAKNHSEDGNASEGGVYSDIYPDQMVEKFNDWCFDENRQKGDVEIIETEYGFHVMYYIGESDITYRDSLIKEEMRDADVSKWMSNLAAEMSLIKYNLDYVNMDYYMS